MKITIDGVLEVAPAGNHWVEIDVNPMDLDLAELVNEVGVDLLLNEIGVENCMDHFDLIEPPNDQPK